MATNRQAFTLIEMFVVISVIVILASIALPMIGIARKIANRTNTLSLMHKISGALTVYRKEIGGYPYAAWPTTLDADKPPGNNLAYYLARNLTTDEIDQLKNDADKAGNAYEVNPPLPVPAPDVSARLNSSDWNQRKVDTFALNSSGSDILHINRMARQWARSNIMVGNVNVKKTKKSAVAGDPWVEDTATPLVKNPQSRGFASDYLGSDLEARNKQGDDILDMWKQPIIYICAIQPGVVGYYAENTASHNLGSTAMIDPGWFGFGPRNMRSPSTIMAGHDMRSNTTPRFLAQFEMMSRGPDLEINALRSQSSNKDNILAADYHRELQ
jgi:prepilin-type N-terminal cleavage/methylation domain-containing protein